MNKKQVLFYLMLLAPSAAQAVEYQTSSGCTVILSGTGNPAESTQWSGDCVDGKASGTGSLVISWGGEQDLRYQGEMRDGMFNGQGVYHSLSGKVYSGEFQDGVPLSVMKGAASSGVDVVAIYNCVIPALSSSVGRELGVWKSRSKPERYYVVSENDYELLLKAKAFGTPNKGNFSVSLSNGDKFTIASNGWTTTNQDEIHNKNSLYGEVSAQPNTAAGKCEYLESGLHKRFTRVN